MKCTLNVNKSKHTMLLSFYHTDIAGSRKLKKLTEKYLFINSSTVRNACKNKATINIDMNIVTIQKGMNLFVYKQNLCVDHTPRYHIHLAHECAEISTAIVKFILFQKFIFHDLKNKQLIENITFIYV